MQEDLQRATGPDGEELILRQQDGGFVVVSGDRVVLSSAARRSELELVNFGLGPLRDRTDATVLLAGLGMGFALRGLLDDRRVARVDVVERSAPLIAWNQGPLAALHREPPLADSRVHVHSMDFLDYLAALKAGAAVGPEPEHGGRFLAIMLDLDNGPSALSRRANEAIYGDEGLQAIEETLRPGGVLSLWSERREEDLMLRLRPRFQNVAEIVVPVDLPDQSLDYLYRCRRGALPGAEPASPPPSSNGHSKSN
jgi:spermidine synthase